jgi:methylamine dehydrogenase accessory protein MauD
MDYILLAARLALAGVFAVAGAAKLLDAQGSTRAFVDFGVPARMAGPLRVLLPLGELAVAIALIPLATAWWAAFGAFALLALFIAGIALNLARGRRPDCHCFGQLHSEPVGAGTLVRNGVLALVAAAVVLAGPGNSGASAFGWLGGLTVGEMALVLLVGVAVLLLGGLVWLQFEVLRQQGRLLLRLDAMEARLDGRYIGNGPLYQIDTHGHGANGHHHAGHDHAARPPEQGLPVGAPSPEVDLPDLDGGRWTLDRLTAPGKPVLLVFVDPHCGSCSGLLPDVGRWQREQSEAVSVMLVSTGKPDENRQKVAEHGVGPVLLQQDFEVATAFEVTGTPSAIVIRPDGTIGSRLAGGADAIRALSMRVLDGKPVAATGDADAVPVAPTWGPAIGEPAPEIDLPDLDGIKLSSSDLRGERTLLLFWNPGCGFCQSMLPDLKAWEADPPPRAPRLVLISSGSEQENRKLGLRAPVLIDQSGTTSSTYGAGGTPMAVVVDAEWRIASELAGGAPACLALAGFRQRVQTA